MFYLELLNVLLTTMVTNVYIITYSSFPCNSMSQGQDRYLCLGKTLVKLYCYFSGTTIIDIYIEEED
jgi:hypothetical protein